MPSILVAKKDGVHMNQIIDNLWLGDIRAANNMFMLKSKGVTHVLQAMGGMNPPFTSHFKYLTL